MLLGISGHLRIDLGFFILGHDHTQLGNGVQVEELVNEPRQNLDRTTKPGGFQILEIERPPQYNERYQN